MLTLVKISSPLAHLKVDILGVSGNRLVLSVPADIWLHKVAKRRWAMATVQGTRCGTHRLPGERYTTAVKARTKDINIFREKICGGSMRVFMRVVDMQNAECRVPGVFRFSIAPRGIFNLIGWLVVGSSKLEVRSAKPSTIHNTKTVLRTPADYAYSRLLSTTHVDIWQLYVRCKGSGSRSEIGANITVLGSSTSCEAFTISTKDTTSQK